MADTHFEMIAKTLYGLEDVLAQELVGLGAEQVETGRRMVSFQGDKELLYKANFHCRTALRVLKPLRHFEADNADMVYEEVKRVEWNQFMTLKNTFAVDAVVYSEDFNHSKFVAYRTKDAIADYFMEKYGERPSVRIDSPDIYINIHISHNECTISLDSSGESLHWRGYRASSGEAPLNEVLAAGMILKTKWRGESNFVDPMCGSGTLLIEAAMIALDIPPGIYRQGFAFENWPDFNEELFSKISEDYDEGEFHFKCLGSDISPKAVENARKNVLSAGLGKFIELEVKPFQQYNEAPQPGILVMNPPYGERISPDNLTELYEMIGERLKHVFMGYEAWILSYKEECFSNIGLRPKAKIKLMNGELECEYRCYEMFSGTNKEYKRERAERGWDADYKPRGREKAGRREFEEDSDFGFRRRNGFKAHRQEDSDKRPKREFREKREFGDKEKRTFEEKPDFRKKRDSGGFKPAKKGKFGERQDRSQEKEFNKKRDLKIRFQEGRTSKGIPRKDFLKKNDFKKEKKKFDKKYR